MHDWDLTLDKIDTEKVISVENNWIAPRHYKAACNVTVYLASNTHSKFKVQFICLIVKPASYHLVFHSLACAHMFGSCD